MKPAFTGLRLLVVTLVGACSAPSTAYALACDALPNASNPDAGGVPSVIYVEGANAAAPLLAPLQQALSVDPNPINVVYIGDGGCIATANLVRSGPIPRTVKPIYYAGQVQGNCDLPTPGGHAPVADIAVSDVYATSCGALPGRLLPTSVGDFVGPIQSMVFAVPKASTQRSISMAAAYFVFGFGSGSGAAPWTVNSSIYRRNSASATQALLAMAIGVPLSQWAGVDAATVPANVSAGLSGAAAVVNALEVDPSPESAIGILSHTNVDPTTASRIAILAYKDSGQSCGYYPDSTATAHDKANVRDGHYTLWGPLHFFTYVDGRGVPRSANAARLISYLIGTEVWPGNIDLIQVEAQNNLVPTCAMRVTRTVEMGPLMSYAPPSCSCYYDYVATGQSSCQKCAKRSDCPPTAPVCNLSYPVAFCETQ